MSHHQIAVLLLILAAALLVLTWLLALAKRDTLRLELLAGVSALVAAAFFVA